MPKHIHIHKNKNKNKNKNTNTNTTNVHIHLNHKRQYVQRKQTVKKEIPTTPTTNPIRTFTPLHQMTNFVPIPGMPLQPAVGVPVTQYSQMASHPQFPIQNPLVQHNPLVNPLRDISGRNRTIQDVFNDRLQLREEAKKKQEKDIQKRIQEHEEKKKQDRSQTLFEVQTKGTFEPLPLFSPFATSEDKQEEEEDPFFKSIFKLSPPQEEIATRSGYLGFTPSVIEDGSKVGNVYLDKHGKKYTYDEYGNKKPVDDSLSPIEEKSEEEDEPPPPPVLKLKKSLSDEEMKEQLGKIKDLSQEYKQGIDLLKEHVVPQPEEEPFVPEYKPTFSSDPSFFDTTLNKTIYKSDRGTYYYFTPRGTKQLLARKDVDRIIAQKQSPNEPKVSFSKLESKLDTIINQSPLKQRAISSLDRLPNETQEEWAKRMREDTAKKEKIAQEKAKKAYDTLQEETQKKETLGEWAKRKKDEKKATEQQIVPGATQVSTPESSAIPIAVATEMTPVAPTVDANAIYTQAAATVQAGLDQTESAKPSATQAAATSTPTMIALNNATNTPQAGNKTGTPGTPVATTPGAGTGTPGALIPTFTKPAVASTIVNTGDKAEWVSQDPADGTTVHKGNDLTVTFTLKNTGTKTWSKAYLFRFYAGDRMNAPSDLNMTKEVKPNDTISFTFAVNIPNRTGDTNTLWVMTNPDGLNFYVVTLKLNVVD